MTVASAIGSRLLPDGDVGLIGVGLMGKPMAKRLLEAQFPLTVFDTRSGPVEELKSAGASVAADPASLASACSVVLSMLPAATHVERAFEDPDGLLDGARPGTLMIDCSTIGPSAARGLAGRCTERGLRFLDAPVSGGVFGAERGQLSIMVGGSVDDLELARPVLDVLGWRVVHCGPAGAGQIAKACNQLVVAVTIEAVAEALLLARAAGANPSSVRDALMGGFASSRVLELHGERMLKRDFDPGGLARLQLKDLRIVASLADEIGMELPELTTVLGRYERMVDEEGLGELDHSAVLLLLERDLGLSIGRHPQRSVRGRGE